MKDMLKPGIILSGIYIVAALALSVLNGTTEPIIKEMNLVASNEARKAVLQDADEFEIMKNVSNENVVEVWEGRSGDKVVGYTMKTLPKGYGGTVEVIVGISSEGVIQGVNIGNHSETPGLGSKAADPAFKDQFIQKSSESLLTVVKGKVNSNSDIAAISGATITSNAVTQGVNSAITIFNENLANK